MPGAGKMVREALAQSDQVVREIAEGSRARQQRDVRPCGERGERRGQPPRRRLSVDRRRALIEQRAARLGLLVANDDACSACGRRERGGEPCGTGARDQHVAMREALRVAVGVRGGRCVAEARRPADGGSYQRCQADRGHMNVL